MTTCNPTETKTWVRSAAESQVLRNYTCHYFFHFHFLHTFFLFLFSIQNIEDTVSKR